MLSWFDLSKGLTLLRNLDWSRANNVLGSIVAVTVLAGIAWAAIRYVWKPLAEWLSRRRRQAKLLDQLVCGSSVAFVENLLGPAQFIGREDGHEQRTYHLAGGWVQIELEDARVVAYSITITNQRMYYSTRRPTFGFLDVRLGKDSFGKPGTIGYRGERSWLGAYRQGYLRKYYFMRSGASQNFYLSYNMAGIGSWSVSIPSSGEPAYDFDTGDFSLDKNLKYERRLEPALDASGTTVNTLTVVHPEAHGSFDRRNILGPDEAHVKMASSIKPPGGTRFDGLKAQWRRVKYLLSKRFK